MNTEMTYKKMLLADLRKGDCISVLEAIDRYGNTNVRKEVLLLRREGHDIRCSMKRAKSGKRYGVYYLVAPGVRRVF